MTDLNEPVTGGVQGRNQAARQWRRRAQSLRLRRRPSCSNSPSSCSSPIAISPAIPTPSSPISISAAPITACCISSIAIRACASPICSTSSTSPSKVSPRVLKQLIDKGYVVQRAGSFGSPRAAAVSHRQGPRTRRAARRAAIRAPCRGIEVGGPRRGSGAVAVSSKPWSMPKNGPKSPPSWRPLQSRSRRAARGRGHDLANADQGPSRSRARRQRAAYPRGRRR